MALRLMGRRPGRRPATGSVMIYAMAGLVMLMFLSVTLLSISRGMVDTSVRRKHELRALAAAEGACSRGLAMLESGAVSGIPYYEMDVPIGQGRMDLEIVPVSSAAAGAYGTDSYEIRGTGRSGTLRRTVALGGSHESLLSYSRFMETGTLGYSAGASLSGKVYCGADLQLSGSPVYFWQPVEVVGTVLNKTYGVFEQGVLEGAPLVSLADCMDVAQYRALAQSAGMYFGSGTPEIDLSLFDFSQATPMYGTQALPSNFNGVIFAEDDLAARGTLAGRSLTLVAGDDVIVSGNVRTGCSRRTFEAVSPSLQLDAAPGVEGVQSVSLNSLMSEVTNAVTVGVSGGVWKRLNLYLYEDSALIGVDTLERPPSVTGALTRRTVLSDLALDPTRHTYHAEIHYWSLAGGPTPVAVEVASGDPVNVALIATDTVFISAQAPRVLRIDAAVFARDGNWRPIDDADTTDWDWSHSACSGVWDLDEDGQIETANEDGWNESSVGSGTWTLTINGPIITKAPGSAGAWSYEGAVQGKGTRHYNYDSDIVHYQPPHFPILLSRWAVHYWREA